MRSGDWLCVSVGSLTWGDHVDGWIVGSGAEKGDVGAPWSLARVINVKTAPAGKECTASPGKRPGLEPGVTAHFTGAAQEEKHAGTLGSSPRGRRKTGSQPHSPGRERVEVAALAVWGAGR